LILLASNYGHVQVRADESGPKLLNDFDARKEINLVAALRICLNMARKSHRDLLETGANSAMLRGYELGYIVKQVNVPTWKNRWFETGNYRSVSLFLSVQIMCCHQRGDDDQRGHQASSP
jgi:hypothetical protein